MAPAGVMQPAAGSGGRAHVESDEDAGPGGETEAPSNTSPPRTDARDPFEPTHTSQLARPGAPIDAPNKRWEYVAFPNTVCQDGESTGLAINLNPESDKLLLYLDDGFPAFNDTTLLITPRSWGRADLASVEDIGLFDRSIADNPFRDWNHVFIPQCTGDALTGAAPRGYGGLPQLGYLNLGEYLARIVPTFPKLAMVVLSGSSSGGFGAAYNWLRVQDAFGAVPVHLVTDSAPPLGAAYIPPCFLKRLAELWNWRATLHPACTECDLSTGDIMTPLLALTLERLGSDHRAGFVSYTEDSALKLFYGFGLNDCAQIDDLLPPTYPEGQYPAGLEALKASFPDHPNVAIYQVSGTDHILFQNPRDVTSAGVKLNTWLSAFATAGSDFVHVGPE